LLAETAQSASSALNQAFLLTSLHRGDRPADDIDRRPHSVI